jgi:hypothetical protein
VKAFNIRTEFDEAFSGRQKQQQLESSKAAWGTSWIVSEQTKGLKQHYKLLIHVWRYVYSCVYHLNQFNLLAQDKTIAFFDVTCNLGRAILIEPMALVALNWARS